MRACWTVVSCHEAQGAAAAPAHAPPAWQREGPRALPPSTPHSSRPRPAPAPAPRPRPPQQTSHLRAIIDKNARIGPNCQIVNKDGVKEAMREDQGYIIKDGIIVIIKDSNIAAGTII